jgi:hypothetical protein
MAEINSRQAAKIAAKTKLLYTEGGGKVRCIVLTSPAAQVIAQNDTIISGIKLPIGTRFLCGSFASHGINGASVTMDVGIRNWKTKAVIDVDGIADGIDIAAAGRTALNNGELVKDGVDSVTTVETEIYATYLSANPTDDAQIRLEIMVCTPD